MTNPILTVFIIAFAILTNTKPLQYSKEYHTNGHLKAEGWLINSQKTDYWKFYNTQENITSEGHYKNDKRDGYWYFYDSSGNILKEGHYVNGIAQEWWIFYDIVQQKKQKIQLQEGKKHGFCLVYHKKKLIKVKKYENDSAKGKWTSMSSFRRDNPQITLLSL